MLKQVVKYVLAAFPNHWYQSSSHSRFLQLTFQTLRYVILQSFASVKPVAVQSHKNIRVFQLQQEDLQQNRISFHEQYVYSTFTAFFLSSLCMIPWFGNEIL